MSISISSKAGNICRAAVTYCLLRSQRNVATTAGLNLQVANCLQNKNPGEPMESLKANPYFEKYADKIATLQQTSPEEFLSRLEVTKKKSAAKPSTEQDGHYSRTGVAKPDVTHSATKQKTLDSVMKLDLICDKSNDEITQIWKDYHKTKDAVAAVIPKGVFCKIMDRASEFPLFLYPVPRAEGFEFVVAQFDNTECHFTTLINYQAHKENAPECLTIIHYPDLMEEKGIVLMHGEYNKDNLNAVEATCLINQLQLYYTAAEDERKYRILSTFNRQPDTFRHMDVVEELQNSVALG